MREPRRKSFVRERSGTLSSSVAFIALVFLRVFMILYMDKTLDEEDVLMIFDDLEVQISHL